MAANTPGGAPRGALEQEPASSLLSRLMSDASALLRNEIALAKAEFRETTTQVKAGVAAMAVAGAVLLAGVLALIAALILALAEVVDPWLAAFIVGAALAVVGFVMLSAAKKQLEPSTLTMERTQNSLKRDADVVARRT